MTDQQNMRRTVLIVDDEAITRKIVAATVERAKFEAQPAQDGEECLTMLCIFGRQPQRCYRRSNRPRC
jgi:CheY-like chemotaxis protein